MCVDVGPVLHGSSLRAGAAGIRRTPDGLRLRPHRLTPGTALIGSSQGAAIYRKGGLRVQASNADSTFFQSNLIALRAEERLDLAVFRPSAFCAVTGLST
ncbi:MAG: phage major capsid protein [Solirubrobacterales bacterium]